MIVLHLIKHKKNWLPMGVSVALDMFQKKVNDIFHGLEHLKSYLYNVLLTTKNKWGYHIVELKRVLLRI